MFPLFTDQNVVNLDSGDPTWASKCVSLFFNRQKLVLVITRCSAQMFTNAIPDPIHVCHHAHVFTLPSAFSPTLFGSLCR